MKFLFVTTTLFLSTSVFAQAQNFPYKNQVWAYPDCNIQSNIRVWSDEGSGGLALYALSEKGVMTNKVKDLKKSAGKISFNYESANASETYEFSGNTARTVDRVVDGKILIKDGVIQATNQPSFNYQSCDKSTLAGKTIMAKIALVADATSPRNSNVSQGAGPAPSPQSTLPAQQQSQPKTQESPTACMKAIDDRYSFNSQDKYGNSSSSKLNDLNYYMTMNPNAPGNKFGNNFAHLYAAVVDTFEGGRMKDRKILKLWCITNASGAVIGIERNYN